MFIVLIPYMYMCTHYIYKHYSVKVNVFGCVVLLDSIMSFETETDLVDGHLVDGRLRKKLQGSMVQSERKHSASRKNAF